jgi:hypothetical protein
VFATGGFVALPVVLAAALARRPIIIHEQTVVPGLANRIAARFARRIAVSFVDAAAVFPAGKVVLTGNPMRPELRSGSRAVALDRFGLDPALPLIYVTGGAQGAHRVNRVMGEALPALLEIAQVIHQCGANPTTGDQAWLEERRGALPPRLAARYTVIPYVGDELASIYATALLVIARAGAGTVNECCQLGLPAVYVPLPSARGGEQMANARLVERAEGRSSCRKPRSPPPRSPTAWGDFSATCAASRRWVSGRCGWRFPTPPSDWRRWSRTPWRRRASAQVRPERASPHTEGRCDRRSCRRPRRARGTRPERGIRRQVRLDERPRLLVRRRAGQEAVTREQASRVRVGHEDRTMGGVDEDRVRRLPAQPRDGQQLASQGAQRRAPQAGEASPEACHEPSCEGLQPRRLEPVRPRRADDVGDCALVHGRHPIGPQQPMPPECFDGPRGVRPRGVLGEDRPDRDLVRRAARPPVLGTEAGQEIDVKPQQAGLDGVQRRSVRHPVGAAAA